MAVTHGSTLFSSPFPRTRCGSGEQNMLWQTAHKVRIYASCKKTPYYMRKIQINFPVRQHVRAQQQPFGFCSLDITRIFSVTLCYTLHAFSISNRLYVSVTQSQSHNCTSPRSGIRAHSVTELTSNGMKVRRRKFVGYSFQFRAPVSMPIQIDGWCNIHINCMLDRHFIECRFGWMNPW